MQCVPEHSVLSGLVNPEVTVLHSHQRQWPQVFLYLFLHLSLSMLHFLTLPQQSIALYNQETTNIIKGSDNCNSWSTSKVIFPSYSASY